MIQSITLRTAEGDRDARPRALLESACGRLDHEALLVEALADSDPAYDPGLELLAERGGQAAGFALFTPRMLRVRGVALPLAIVAPLAVAPAQRRSGVARFLLEAGRAALRERGMLGAVTIGAPELFTRVGYASAFDMYFVRTPSEYLPEEGDTRAWRALDSSDLAELCALQEASYRRISGSERRRACALDWEGLAESSFTLVHDVGRGPDAYLRFRRREGLEVTECGVRDPGGVDATLRLMRRLAREHASPVLSATLAPGHPVARALYQRGGMIERCDFGGAAFLGVFDWHALFEALRPWWSSVLACFAPNSLELSIEGQGVVLGRKDQRPRNRLWIPDGWGPSLVTGRRCAEDLLFEPEVRESSQLDEQGEALVRVLFTRRDAAWTYGPAFELADD